MNYFEDKKQAGFSLLELVLAIAIFSISSFAIVSLLIDSTTSTRFYSERIEAQLFAKEGIEAVKSIRDADWSALIDGDHGIDDSGGLWVLSSSSDLINDKYTRVINIFSENSYSKILTCTVSWNLTPVRNVNITLKTVITDWKRNVISSIPSDNLISFWKFDDALVGTAIDSVGTSTGTVYGATSTYGVKGLANTAYSFDGSSYITVDGEGILNGLSDITMSVWFEMQTGSGNRWIVAKSNTSSVRSYDMYVDDTDKIQARVCGDASCSDGVPLTSVLEVSDDVWHNLVYTYQNPGGASLYLNGVLEATSTSVLTATTTTLSSEPFVIGANSGFSGNFIGFIDEVRIYNRALTEEEVQTIYNEEKS